MGRMKKSWYAAHILMAIKRVDGKQRTFPIFENVVIFQGVSAAAVRQVATEHAHEEYEGDSSLTLNGRPARMVFVGIRKIVECQDSTARALRSPVKRNRGPGEGTEVTYSVYSVAGAVGLKALAAGKKVSVVYDGG